MLRANAGRLRGAVRYPLDGEPAMVAVCHCRTCQRNSGSASSVNVAMPRDAVHVQGDSLWSCQTHPQDGGRPF